MSFGKTFKEIRLKNNDSLRGLGEKIDISFSYIDQIEKGLRPINKDILEKFILYIKSNLKKHILMKLCQKV